jgi:2-polyprenyl-6-methoxyphenol hydroxylase-like FAD-dependent oxidoreductase
MRIAGSNWDVLVVGGGPAGLVAAIQAGRLGARVLLVEKNGMLGGTTTVAGVSFPGLFHAWGRQVIAGIGWELMEQAVRESGRTLPDFTVPFKEGEHWRHHIAFDGAVYAMLCDEAVAASGCELLLHAMPAAVARDGARWQVTLATKSGLQTVTATLLIDGTGDANLAALAGAQLIAPKELQPGTLTCRAAGYDPAALDMALLNRRFREAIVQGELQASDACWNIQSPSLRWLQKAGSNANHIPVLDAQSSEGKTRLELDARRSLLRLYRFLRRQPGLQGLRIDWLCVECGMRESVTVVGDATITHADYVSGRLWADAVCHSFYPIDLHRLDKDGIDYCVLPEGVVPTVPLGALIPRDMEGLLVAGRCLSSDRLANSALRTQPCCMATGQAAGAVVALAARTATPVRQVPLQQIRDVLRKHGAIVPEVPSA